MTTHRLSIHKPIPIEARENTASSVHDIRFSKNNMQILSAFNFSSLKTLFRMGFFSHLYNFHHLGVREGQMSVTDRVVEKGIRFSVK